ncbi:DNA-directed RNA polymerase III subunit RPC7-like isoform X3 [Aphelocoma coerulescens]|uniref:DNA-directed RNA polymerase III subunit RPC7-like isoform X3 n=1 Tax=Aphelocoma coerulescens TaxID=39617 RepID=UPI0036044C02
MEVSPCPPCPQRPPGPSMAGRGRGRGRGQMTFNVEAVGIGKGDALPPPTLQPSPLFPALERRAAPLPGGEEGEYMLALKQELRRAMRGLPYFVKPGAPRRGLTVPCAPPGTTPLVPKQHVALDKEETIKKLETLEKKEEEVTSEEEEEKEEEEEGKEEEEEEYDEEEHEEETDYVLSYFDNGESFGPDSDDNGDEAVY